MPDAHWVEGWRKCVSNRRYMTGLYSNECRPFGPEGDGQPADLLNISDLRIVRALNHDGCKYPMDSRVSAM
jgi:hypothetical protein